MKQAIKDVAGIQKLQFNEQGLVPVIAQDQATGAVLMLAWANAEALKTSLETGRMTYFSRSRQAIWVKGETSGNTQQLVSLAADCDGDAMLATVIQKGPACHQETTTCWSANRDAVVASELGEIDQMARQRKAAPQGRYTDSLLTDARFAAEKIVEEANEVAAVLRGEDNEDTLAHEAADLLYHLVVGLHAGGSELIEALAELRKRS